MSASSDWNPVRHAGTHCFSWCAEAHRLEAFVGGLEALVPEFGSGVEILGNASRLGMSVPTAASLLQKEYLMDGYARAFFKWRGPSGRLLEVRTHVASDRKLLIWPGPNHLDFSSSDRISEQVFPSHIALARNRAGHSLAVTAAIACHLTMIDMVDFLRRVWTASPAITTGVCSNDIRWYHPIEMAASYNADGNPGRDLALSWIHLHEGARLENEAGLSMDRLCERIAAAPLGSTVSLWCGDRLTREEVIEALAIPQAELVLALEANATPDPEWIDVEPRAQHALRAATEKDVYLEEVRVDSDEHNQFIRQHAPTEVQKLKTGALLLATHPYRTLWPLWADALRLLDIRS